MVSQFALLCIDGYQRWISPHKGYRCAYSVRHGGPGCSGFAKHAIRDHGLWRAAPLIKARFAACKTAALAFAAERADEASTDHDTHRQKKKKKDRDGGTTCYACIDPFPCTPFGWGAGRERSVVDTNPCDGDVGCGPCEVDVCSCGN